MRALGLDEIRTAVHGIWCSSPTPVTIDRVSTDTRTAQKGDLYVALKGNRFDGHDFLEAAGKAGCIGAIVRRDFELSPKIAKLFGGGLIAVRDTTKALGELGGYYRQQVPARVVAVTGSNGKTTTKRMIHQILSTRLSGSCSPKSFNNAVGVPLTLLGVEPADDYVVCELGSSAPGEVTALSRITRPNFAVITSVAPTHLEGFGSVERVAIEKASILVGLDKRGVAVVFSDSPPLDPALRAYDSHIIRFGVSDSAQLRLTRYKSNGASQRFQINGRLWVKLPLPGRHNALNALAAIAIAQRFGFEQEAAAEALKDFPPQEMRMELVQCGGVLVINDAYNANPESMLVAAEVLGDFKGRRRVMIAGDMRELGAQAEQLHLQLGRDLGGVKIDLLIGVGELGRYIATGAGETGMITETFDSTETACTKVPGLLQEGDLVLIKGSRAMEMERLVEPIRAAFPAPAAAPERKKTEGSER